MAKGIVFLFTSEQQISQANTAGLKHSLLIILNSLPINNLEHHGFGTKRAISGAAPPGSTAHGALWGLKFYA